MKKIVALLLCVLCLAGCGKAQPAPEVEEDYTTQIREELLNKKSKIEKKVARVLELQQEEAGADYVIVTVTAPYIYEDLLDWFENISDADYSDAAMEDQILELLKGKSQSKQFTLELQDGQPVYTEEFLDAASCGLRRFYATLTAMLMEEMEASVND